MNGVLVASGFGVSSDGPDRGPGARVLDIAPTVLHLLGESVPETMEGRVLEDLLDSAFLESHPVTRGGRQGEAELALDDERDDDEIRRRLEDLGYM